MTVSLLDDALDAHTRHVFAGSGYTLGRFDCPPNAPRWAEVNWIGREPHIVVPRTVVRIAAEGAGETVATPHDLLLYDADTHYRRRAVAGEGDRCLFAVIGPDLAAELDLAVGPARPRLRRVATASASFATLAHVEAALARGDATDLSAIDEWVLVALAGAVGASDNPPARDAVEEVKALLAGEPRSLADLGAAVHYSPFALARMFRAYTGLSITDYRRQLRLRRSYADAIRPGADLSRVAAEHGFASHSHYTREFRRTFGHPPTTARALRFPAAA